MGDAAAAKGSFADDEQQPLIPKRAAGPSRGLVFVAVFGAALLLGAAVSARGGAARQPQALRASAPAGRTRGDGTRARCAVPDTRAVLATHGALLERRFGTAATAADGGAALPFLTYP